MHPYQQLYHDYVYGKWLETGISFAFIFWLAATLLYQLWYGPAKWMTNITRAGWYKLRTWRMTPETYDKWVKSRLASRVIDALDDMVACRLVTSSWANKMGDQLGHLLEVSDLVQGKGHPSNHVELGTAVPLPDAKNGRAKSAFGQRLQRIINRRNGFE